MSLCDSQDTFNTAVKTALDNYSGRNKKGYKATMIAVLVIWLLLLVWAVMIAIKIPDKEHKTLHLFFALTCPPVYIIASLL